MSTARERAAELLKLLKQRREESKSLSDTVHKVQDDALEMMKVADPDNEGIEYEWNGTTYVSKRRQNRPREDWDLGELVPYLKSIGMWDSVSTTVLDPDKLTAEIKAGGLSAKVLEKFKVVGEDPAPWVDSYEKKRRRVVRRKKRS